MLRILNFADAFTAAIATLKPGTEGMRYALHILNSLAALLFLLWAGAASAKNPASPEAHFSGGLDPRVSAVASGGYWEGDGRHGRYRVVVLSYGDEHVYSRAYAQWLTLGEGGSMQEWITKPIPQLSDEPLSIVRSVEIEEPTAAGFATFEAAVANRYSTETRSVKIRLGAPGDVSVVGPSP